MMKIATESMTKKQPRTFSLSRDVIDILERYKKERKAGSLTAAVEEIVREWTTVQMASASGSRAVGSKPMLAG